MNLKISLGLIALLIGATLLYSQENPPRGGNFSGENRRFPGGTISGRVLDQAAGVPIEYANIILKSRRDSTLATGTITDESGKFTLTGLRPGPYEVEVDFLGYHAKLLDNIALRRGSMNIDLGDIFLVPAAVSAQTVEVEAQRSPISYQIDKKVISVDQQITAASGNAVDVLQNVPSVQVDIEGHVSLRGSGNFRVLIDGRPSVLDPSDALQQIPASSIENIEIITNPSAKYDPEGSAGIINIVMKKNRRPGRSGIANLNAGLNDKYGGDAIVAFKNEKYNLTLGGDYNRNFFTGEEREENITTREGQSSYVFSEGDSRRGRIALGLRGSLDLHLSPRDVLTFSGRFGDRDSRRNAGMDFEERHDPSLVSRIYTSIGQRRRGGIFYALNSSYLHQFAGKGHQLIGDLFYSYRDSDEETLNELRTPDGAISSGQISTESGPGSELRAKLDYLRPMGESQKFEAGWQTELDRSHEQSGLLEYDPAAGDYVSRPQFSNLTRYQRDIHAVYAIYGGEWKNLGFQGGVRGEYTGRRVEFDRVEQPFIIDRWDYFPSVHTSYRLSGGQQFMASYSRRIDRPRGWYLEPFETWMDAFNLRIGNPSLKPEYIDAYEAGFQTYFGKNLFSAEIYYRKTHNKVERVRSVYADNITLHSIENVGTDASLGSEFLLNMDLTRRWNVNLVGNLYDYRVEGVLQGVPFERERFNWSGRMSHTLRFGPATQVQIDGQYHSPSVSSQGRREGFFSSNAAVRHEFLQRQLSVTLQIRDLFGTRKFESTTEGPGFFTYSYGTREAPVVMLNLRYNFNNYKPERPRERQGGNGGGGEEEEF